EGPQSLAATIALLRKLDHLDPPNDPLLEKAADALSNRVATPANLNELVALLSLSHKPARIAAATCLLRGTDQPVKDRVSALWSGTNGGKLEALVEDVARVSATAGRLFVTRWLVAAHK